MISIIIFQLRRSISCTHRFILINKSGAAVSFRCTTSSPFAIFHYGEEEKNKYVTLKPQRNAEVKPEHCEKLPHRKFFLVPIFPYSDTFHAVQGIFISNHRRCSIKIAALKNFAIFAGKHLCWSHFFNKVPGLKACNVIKNRFQHSCFPVNIANP